MQNVSNHKMTPCMSSNEEGDNNSKDEDCIIYQLIDKRDWRKVGGRTRTMIIKPIPFTGNNEEFPRNISNKQLEGLIDYSGNLRFSKVFQWLLPKYKDKSFWEFLAAQPRRETVWYNSCNQTNTSHGTITLTRMLLSPLITPTTSVDVPWENAPLFPVYRRNVVDARRYIFCVSPVNKSMPQDVPKDSCQCMHFSDDWEEEEDIAWDKVYCHMRQNIIKIWLHWGRIQQMAEGEHFLWRAVDGRWSRVVGWYNSYMTILSPSQNRLGLEKQHTICVSPLDH